MDLTPAQKQQLTKYKTYLRKLTQKNSLATKKRILTQHGGFLQYLLPAVIPAVEAIWRAVTNKE